MKASLLIALYSVRRERAFCEEREYNLLYRWFLDMDLMERSFDATVFTKNRQRLLAHDAGRALFDEVVWAADEEGLLSDEPFSVDGTLIEAAASLRNSRSKEGAAPACGRRSGQSLGGFPGRAPVQRDPRQHHGPRGAPAAQGAGQGGSVGVYGPRPDGNRHGLLMDFTVSQATGTAERDAVPELLDGVRERGYRPRTLGADRGYDTKDCVGDMRARRVTPHVARKKKHSALDGRTTRHAGYAGYAVSLRLRKRVEEVFGWMKTVGGFQRTRYRGVARTGRAGYLVATAYNLVRLAKLLDEPEAAAGPSP